MGEVARSSHFTSTFGLVLLIRAGLAKSLDTRWYEAIGIILDTQNRGSTRVDSV